MLPVHRIIGHKDYGNTPPGGWKDRKRDPAYDMNWRRDRVANFQPRGDDMPSPEDVWNYSIDGVRARDRLLGIDAFVPKRVWEEKVHGVAAMDRLRGIDDIRIPELAGQVAGLQAALGVLATANGGVDTQIILDRIDEKVAEAMDAFRDRVVEGYDVRLEPKTDSDS